LLLLLLEEEEAVKVVDKESEAVTRAAASN
jgi:hypothetical protein